MTGFRVLWGLPTASMEMPARRSSSYSLLNQTPDDNLTVPLFDSSSGDGNNNRNKLERISDWESVVDHRQGNRIGNLYPSLRMQRQSSGSSFGESSLSGEFYTTPAMFTVAPDETDEFTSGEVRGRIPDLGAARSDRSYGRSWAQQTEESYQLQLALALRLYSEATCADDPNFLDPVPDESPSRSSYSAETVSHRFWVCWLLVMPIVLFLLWLVVKFRW